ncbi:hypothetical protein G9A89_020991 [Geosiphon pyriformis]|nr:hypothetical protein G9A89_020991 [Geosiphon pyriformis]
MPSILKSFTSSITKPFRVTRQFAHEKPTYFWSLLVGTAGPLAVLIVPPIQKRIGHVRPERPPITYPMPQRPRRPTYGYEDS